MVGQCCRDDVNDGAFIEPIFVAPAVATVLIKAKGLTVVAARTALNRQLN